MSKSAAPRSLPPEAPDRVVPAPARSLSAPFRLRERNKLEKRQRIREATRELFSARGFEAATLRQIAERAQVGLGTLFQYAHDKRDLIFLLFNEDLARLVDEAAVASARESRILDQVMAIWEPHYRFFAQDPVLCRILLRDMYFYTAGGEALRFNETAKRLRGLLASLVAAAREEGELTRIASEADMVSLLFSAFESSVRDWMREEAPVASEGVTTLRRRVRLQLRAFMPEGTQAHEAERPPRSGRRAGQTHRVGRRTRLPGGIQ